MTTQELIIEGTLEEMESYIEALRFALDVVEEQTEPGLGGVNRKHLWFNPHTSRLGRVVIRLNGNGKNSEDYSI